MNIGLGAIWRMASLGRIWPVVTIVIVAIPYAQYLVRMRLADRRFTQNDHSDSPSARRARATEFISCSYTHVVQVTNTCIVCES